MRRLIGAGTKGLEWVNTPETNLGLSEMLSMRSAIHLWAFPIEKAPEKGELGPWLMLGRNLRDEVNKKY